MQPAPFLIFIIDSRTWIVKHKNIAILASQILLPAPRADMHRAALLFVGFYGILLAERRCPASAAVMLPPDVKSGGSSISVVLRTVRMFHQCDMDDLEGCLSGQTSGKALF